MPKPFSAVGPMAWTVAWLGVLDPAGHVQERETGDTDILTPLVAELITQEVLCDRASA